MINDKNLQKELERLNLTDPDEIVEFIEKFYNKAEIKDEKTLVENLSKYKPIMTAIDLQKQKRR